MGSDEELKDAGELEEAPSLGKRVYLRSWHNPNASTPAPQGEPFVCRLKFESQGDERSAVIGDRSALIGRAPGCDVVLTEESVSRNHARISRCEDGWVLSDLDSKNGVKINGERILERRLSSGDRLEIGTVRLWVEIARVPPEARARVVFEEQPERGTRTGVIEMARLDGLFAPEPDVAAEERKARPAGGRSMPSPNPAGLMRLVSEAAEALLSCDSLDETLERILAIVFANLPAERGVICLYDEATETSEAKVMRNRDGSSDEPIVISSNIANDVIKRKQSLLVHDTKTDERFGAADSVVSMEIHSAMCAPLYHDGHVVGFVYVDRQDARNPFETHHLHALSTLAMLSAVAVVQASLRDAVRHEQDMRARLARYSSRAVVDRILQTPSSAPEAGMVAEEGEVTVLFADIIGFTPLAERLGSSEVVRILNRVFEQLTDAVFEFDGTLDKFRGDGMMAFFGAPIPLPDHAVRAARAALRMQELIANLDVRADGVHRLSLRIGINSGLVVVGDIGTPERKDYTVIGDVVNTASRLESAVAGPGQIVLGPATYERVAHRFRCESLDAMRLKGKRRKVSPYLLLGPA